MPYPSRVIEGVGVALDVPVAPLRDRARQYAAEVNVHPEETRGLFHGILTTDGVHPCGQWDDADFVTRGGLVQRCPEHSHGNALIADAVAGALVHALQHRRPKRLS